MKKTRIITLSLLTLMAVSCSKNSNKQFTINSGSNTQQTNQKEAILKQINSLRATLNAKKKMGGNYPLGFIQKAVDYGGADATGAGIGFKLTSWWCGPAYGAAFGFLGAVAGSAYHYVDNHYDFYIIEGASSGDGTNTYSNEFEKMGYYHNIELMKLYTIDSVRPSSPTEFLNKYYDLYCDDAASAFGLNVDSIKMVVPKSDLISILNDRPYYQTPSDFKTYALSKGVDSTVVDYVYDLFVDVHNENITVKSEVFAFADLYLTLADSDTALSTSQKNQIKYVVNIFKYSFSLWSNNDL